MVCAELVDLDWFGVFVQDDKDGIYGKGRILMDAVCISFGYVYWRRLRL